MTDRVEIPAGRIVPLSGDVLHGQGIPRGTPVGGRIMRLAEEAVGIVAAEARPECVAREVTVGQFDDIFKGEGLNEPEAPLGAIYPKADHLVVFALTAGHGLSARITELLGANDFALGSMLDTAASIAADRAVAYLERLIGARFAAEESTGNDRVALNFSPGYCGWHISAQRQLFGRLGPERIGITLNESCLMTPLKSVTGVIVHGAKGIHDFDYGFSFCRTCRDRTCLERMER